MSSMLQDIEDKMGELIAEMQALPYNFMWGTNVNERDYAKAQWPNAVIYFEEEVCLDEEGGAWCGAYYQEVIYRIEVMTRLDAEYANPVVEIRKEFYKCLDDLKRLFGTHWNLEGKADTIMYKGASIEEKANGDIFIPSKLITKWKIKYEQDRVDPTLGVQ